MLNRTQTADVLKGIAILLMIQVHIVELFAGTSISSGSTGNLLLFLGGPPVAPIFMTAFGYFMFSNHKSMKELMMRGVKIFMLGMLLNVALNFNLLFKVSRGILSLDIWPYVFGVDILQFAGISLVIMAALKSVFEKHLAVIFIAIFLSAFFGNILLQVVPDSAFLKYLSAFIYGSTYWSYFPLFPWLAYPLAGVALHQLQQRYDFKFFYLGKTKLLFGIIFLLFFLLTMNYAVSVSSNLPLYYHHDILFFMWVILFCLLYSLLIHEINSWIGETKGIRYIKWLGRHVTLMYVIQWILIGNIATTIYKTVTSPLYLVFWFIGITAVTSGMAYLGLRLKTRWSKN